MTQAAVNLPIRGNKMSGRQNILDMPRAGIYRAAALGIITGTPTAVPWDTLDYDTDGMWSAASPTALFARTAGTYRFTCWGNFANAADTTYRQFYFTKNIADARGQVTVAAINGLQTAICSSIDYPMNAGDFIQPIWAHVSATTPLAFSVATAATRINGFTACLLST